jgi:hypothetical protein
LARWYLLNGEFYKSDWENGELNGGKFYYSKFYNGVVNNGRIGDSSIPLDNTVVYNGTINYTAVENSRIVSLIMDFLIIPQNSLEKWYI